MKILLREETQEFIAKYFCDMSKAILTVGLASYFFKDMSWFWRIGLTSVAFAFLLISVIIINIKGGDKL